MNQRVLHIGKYYNPFVGGVESINETVVKSLVNFEHCVISYNKSNITEYDTIDKVPVIRSSSLGVIASQPVSISYYKNLKKFIREFRPDIIHFHYPNPLGLIYFLLCNTHKAKIIVHWHSDIIQQKLLSRLLAPLDRVLLRKANVIVTTNENLANKSPLLKNFKSKVKIIPCSIQEEKFIVRDSEKNAIEQIKENYNKPIVFFFGRHVEYKGLKYLLEAEKLVKSDCHFIIAGEGPLTEKLKNKYPSDRITWIGKLDDNNLKYYLYASKVFAFPSITRNEAFGVALAEAMYTGAVPITFTIEGSGVNWVSLKDLTGLETANGNIKEYAEAIDLLLSDEKLRTTLSQNSIRRIKENFTFENVKKLYQQLYDSL